MATATPPGSAYVAFTDSTGCRVPEEIEVHRDGDDLEVVFTGDAERAACSERAPTEDDVPNGITLAP